MKPIKLQIEGLNSFSSKQTIDFEQLSSRGLFGIFGKTGSGKSTILDAITLALYGKVNRSKLKTDFINLKSRETNVSLVFEIMTKSGLKKYEATRKYKLKKNNREADSYATLYEYNDEERVVVAEGTYNVDTYLMGVLGLSMEEFSKCIALPQGEFASFLKCRPNERIEIIGNIFDLDEYGTPLWERVKERVAELETELSNYNARIDTIGEVKEEDFERLKSELEFKMANLSAVNTLLNSKTVEVGKLDALGNRLTHFEEKKNRLKEMELESSSIENMRRDIELYQSYENYFEQLSKLEEQNDELTKLDKEKEHLTEHEKMLEDKKEKLSESVINEQHKCQDGIIEFTKMEEKFRQFNEISLRLKTLQQDRQNLQNDKEKIQKERNLNQKELVELQNELADNESKKSKLEEDLANIGVDDESIVLAFEAEIESLKEIEQKLETIKSEADSDWHESKANYDNFVNELSVNNSAFDKACEKLGVVVSQGDIAQRIKACESRQFDYDKAKFMFEQIDTEIARNEQNIESIKTKIYAIDEDIDNEKGKLLACENQLSSVCVSLNKLDEEKEAYLGEHFLDLLNDSVNIGDECPLCRSQVIQKSGHHKSDMSGFYAEKKRLEANKKQIEVAKGRVEFDISRLTGKKEFEEDEIARLKDANIRLNEEKNAILKRFVDLNEYKWENFEQVISNNEKMLVNYNKLDMIKDKLIEDKLSLEIKRAESSAYMLSKKEFIENITDLQRGVLSKIAEKELLVYNSNNLYADKKELALEKKRISNELKKCAEIREQNLIAQNNITLKSSEIVHGLLNIEEKLANNQAEVDRLKSQIAPEFSRENDAIEVLKSAKDKMQECQSSLEREQNNLNACVLELQACEKNRELVLQKIELIKLSVKDTSELFTNLGADVKTKLEELRRNFESVEDVNVAKQRIADFEKERLLLQNEIDELNNEILSLGYSEESRKEAKKLLKDKQNEKDGLIAEIAKMQENIKNYEEKLQNLQNFGEKLRKIESKLKVANELKDLLRGKQLEEYVAEEFMEYIVDVASVKLQTLLDGRYDLEFRNNEFIVVDNFNDGNVRTVSTLSGGEIFVVSLCLALSISESIVSLSNRSFDFFFLDEGFGALDAELCETVVSSLTKLQSQNIVIGVISHVPELQERIKNKIVIKKTESEGSTIQYQYDF